MKNILNICWTSIMTLFTNNFTKLFSIQQYQEFVQLLSIKNIINKKTFVQNLPNATEIYNLTKTYNPPKCNL